jgi:hypothetical protein
MPFHAKIKARSETGSKIDIAIIVDGVEYVERVQVDDLLDNESQTLESKFRLAKLELIRLMRQKRKRRLSVQELAEYGEKELDI